MPKTQLLVVNTFDRQCLYSMAQLRHCLTALNLTVKPRGMGGVRLFGLPVCLHLQFTLCVTAHGWGAARPHSCAHFRALKPQIGVVVSDHLRPRRRVWKICDDMIPI